jgi:hypothetical protein
MNEAVWVDSDWMKDVKDEDEKEEPCLHDSCSECHGTGKKKDGTTCIHWISCPCPKCTPRF